MLPFKNHPGTTLAFSCDVHGRETSATLKRGATLLGISARSYDASAGRLSGASFGGIARFFNDDNLALLRIVIDINLFNK